MWFPPKPPASAAAVLFKHLTKHFTAGEPSRVWGGGACLRAAAERDAFPVPRSLDPAPGEASSSAAGLQTSGKHSAGLPREGGSLLRVTQQSLGVEGGSGGWGTEPHQAAGGSSSHSPAPPWSPSPAVSSCLRAGRQRAVKVAADMALGASLHISNPQAPPL